MTDGCSDEVLIYGAGGHAKSVISVMHAEGRWRVAGVLVDKGVVPDSQILGYALLGDERRLVELRKAGIDAALVAVGDNHARGRIAGMLRGAGYRLVNTVHPSAACMTGSSLASGAFVHAFTVIGAECRVGANAIIQPFTSLGHESRIGDCVQFSPGVHVGGKVRIGDYCFFGPGSVVYPGVTIGSNVSVGANSVVNKDVPDNAVIVGTPGRTVRKNKPPPASLPE